MWKARFLPSFAEIVLQNQWLTLDAKFFTDSAKLFCMEHMVLYTTDERQSLISVWFIFSVLFILTSLFYLGLQIAVTLSCLTLFCIVFQSVNYLFFMFQTEKQFSIPQCNALHLAFLCATINQSFLAHSRVWLPVMCTLIAH